MTVSNATDKNPN